MKKVFVLLSIVALGLFVSTPIKAQSIGVVDVPGTCKNWVNDIYKIVTEKGDSADSVIIKTEKGLEEKVVWTKNALVIKGVTFYPASQIFEKSGKNYTPDNSYFDELYDVWAGVYKQYKKGIYSPDFKG